MVYYLVCLCLFGALYWRIACGIAQYFIAYSQILDGVSSCCYWSIEQYADYGKGRLAAASFRARNMVCRGYNELGCANIQRRLVKRQRYQKAGIYSPPFLFIKIHYTSIH